MAIVTFDEDGVIETVNSGLGKPVWPVTGRTGWPPFQDVDERCGCRAPSQSIVGV